MHRRSAGRWAPDPLSRLGSPRAGSPARPSSAPRRSNSLRPILARRV